MNEVNVSAKNDAQRNEIDFMDLFRLLWAKRKVLFISLGVGAVLGLFIALITPEEFKVTTTMLPQSESGNGLGQFSSLAAIAGFELDMSSSSTEISPVVFPQIVESGPFLAKLMNIPFSFEKADHPVSILEYYTKVKKPSFFETFAKYTIGLPGLIKGSLKKKPKDIGVGGKQSIYSYSKDETDIMLFLSGRVVLSINKKEGYLTLDCVMPERLLAAEVAKKAQELLQEVIIEYKTQSATEQLAFIEKRAKEKKQECENAQQRLAWHVDRNRNSTTATALIERDRLQGEYDIAYSVYSELAKTLEQSKIQVKRKTPVFAIIKPVVVPVEKDKPKRAMILFVYTLLGCIVGIAIVVINDNMPKLKKLMAGSKKLAS